MIHFGTAGWRGVVGHDFTFRNVRLVLEATVAVLRARKVTGEVLISYDTRLLSEKFAREAVDVLTHHGITAVLSDRDLPSPCVAFAVREREAALGVTFTASHNPPEYNGVKLYTRGGIPAGHEFTEAVEAEVRSREEGFDDFYVPQRRLGRTEPLSDGYLAALESGIDWEAIRRRGLIVAVDPLYGTSREFLDRLLIAHQIPTRVIHNTKDPYFGGYAPECTPPNLEGLRELVRSSGAHVGLATDGDGDRFGVVDGSCRVMSSNVAIALLIRYLITRQHLPGGVARTVGTTRLVDRIAAAHERECIETRVGFQHLAPLLLSRRIGVAAEESAGLGLAGHLPERDGIFAALLMAEMLAVEGRTLAQLTASLYAEFGTLVSRRVQLPLNDRTRAAFDRLRSRRIEEIAGARVVRADRSDGLLLELEGDGWVLLRPSGTEPRLRLYAEAASSRALRALVREARRLLKESEEDR